MMAAPNEEISVTQGVMNQWWPWALTRALGTRVRDASLVRTCARSCESRTMRLQHSAAKDRDFKTVRPNQGTLTDAQTLLRGTPTNRFSLCRSGIRVRSTIMARGCTTQSPQVGCGRGAS